MVGAGSTACATKKYVNNRVDDVNSKVSTLSESVEETQERTRQNEQRIGEVDQKADAASAGRRRGRPAAESAPTRRPPRPTPRSTQSTRPQRLVYEVVLRDDNSRFAFGKAALASKPRRRSTRSSTSWPPIPRTSSWRSRGTPTRVGPPTLNEQLGLQRAEAVKRYLYEQHSVPLHKMNVISYGESKPVAPNETKEGRAKNRRVVIKVLA